MSSTRVFHVSLADALSKGPPPPGSLAVPVFSHGPLWLSFSLRLGKTRRSRIHKTRCTLSPVGQVYSLMARGDTPWKLVHFYLFRLARAIGSRTFHPILSFG